MIASEGVIGFALAFLGTSLLLSLALGRLHVMGARRLRALGPSAERRVALLVVGLPPVLALLVTAVLAIDSAIAVRAGTDHCLDHAHHLHLCLVHGAPWGSHPWAIALVAFGAAVVALRLGRLVVANLKAERDARRLALHATLASDEHLAGASFRLVPSTDAFAFTAGIFRPTIFVSEGAWERLTAEQRRAVLTHEQGHVRRSDLRHRAMLGALASLGLPWVTARALRAWELAAERLCDRDAAGAVERPTIVASAIVAMARAAPRAPTLAAAFAAGSLVDERVHALLGDEPDRRLHARLLTLLLLLAAAALLGASALQSEPLHHAIETIVG